MTDEITRRDTGGGPGQAARYGDLTAGGGASFRCATCGEVAAMVKLLRAGDMADMGPPLGGQRQDRAGLVIDYWLGSTCWMALGPDTLTPVAEALAAGTPDAAVLHGIDWEYAPFYCRGCETCYCRTDWHPVPIWDGPFYDYTQGRCPAGHQQMIDD